MYNRYVPQSDGTFRKSRLSEPGTCRPETQEPEPPAPDFSPLPVHRESAGSFLKGLLPQGLDTEDLIVILLLLLISGKQEDGGNQALLTLGAYLFL